MTAGLKKSSIWQNLNGVTRIIFWNILAAVPMVVLVLAYIIPTYANRYLQDRKDMTRVAVESVFNILQFYDSKVAASELSLASAQKQALAQIKMLRYSDKEYFWINDLSPKMLMHPTKPELDGKDLSEFKDPNGNKIFKMMVEASAQSGSATVDYLWPKPGSDIPVPKTSYVKRFTPWGWIVGNGVYIDDVTTEIDNFRSKIFQWLSLCLGISLMIAIASGIFYARTTLKTIKVVTGDLSAEAEHLLESADRVKTASNAFSAATHRQTSVIEATSTTANKMATHLAQNNLKTEEMLRHTADGRQEAEGGKIVVQRLLMAMSEIHDTNEHLEKIVSVIKEINNHTKVINDIAFETRLLAFNASIEAARAGAHGRGFAVVAEEVGKLASVSNKAADEVRRLLEASVNDVSEIVGETRAKVQMGQQRSQECALAFDRMEGALISIARSVDSIVHVTRDQEAGIKQTTEAMSDMDRSTQQSSRDVGALAHEAGLLIETARKLTQSAHEMRRIISGSKTIPTDSKPASNSATSPSLDQVA